MKKNGDSGELSQLLMHPTTANIRQECFNVYNERIKRGEEEQNTLRAFFGVPPVGKKFGHIIEKYTADRFRPLQNLIRGEIKNPASANVELLAWLIDFTPRPLGYAQQILKDTNEIINPYNLITDSVEEIPEQGLPKDNDTEVEKEFANTNTVVKEDFWQDGKDKISVTDNTDSSNLTIKKPGNNLKNSKLKNATIALIITLFLGGMYAIWQHEKSGGLAFGNVNTGCMYWAADHYEKVPCTEKGKGFILPLDEERIKNFKRIVQEDTISEKSIGVIYYLKTNNKPEYFTSGGNHPVYINRNLKILSRYIYDEYLRKREAPIIDSLNERNTTDANKR